MSGVELNNEVDRLVVDQPELKLIVAGLFAEEQSFKGDQTIVGIVVLKLRFEMSHYLGLNLYETITLFYYV